MSICGALNNVQAMEARIQMLENKLTASEHMGRYNDSVRSQDVNSRILKLETMVS